MTTIRINFEIFRYAAITAWEDFKVNYSLRSWVAEWMTRIIFQMIFFGLIGRMIGSDETIRFIVIGNSAMLASMTAMFVVQSTVWERWTGSLPLLVAAPANPLVVFLGRSIEWIPDAVVTSIAGLLIVGPMFGVSVGLVDGSLFAILILLITVSTYMMGAFLGSLAMRVPNARNLVANLAHSTMMVVCGVNVPTSFFPEPVQRLASVLPLTHGLRAIRRLLDGDTSRISHEIWMEIIVGMCWLAVALVSFKWLAEGGRKDGSIEFGT